MEIQNPLVDWDLAALADTIGLPVIAGQAPDVAGSYDASAADGSRFTDDTTDFGDAGTADSLFFPATEEDELDYFLLGHATPYFGAEILLSATVGVGGVVAWEYCRGPGSDGDGLWTAFPAGTYFDGSASLTQDGILLFAPPEDWVPAQLDEVDATERYYIRARVTTVYSTNPVGDSVLPLEMDTAHVTNGYVALTSGLVESILVSAITAGGGNNNTVVQVINHTKKSRGYYSAANNALIVELAAVKKVFVEAGDILTLHVLQEDGTTELQTAKVELLITI